MDKSIFERTKQEIINERDRLINAKMESVQSEFILPTYQKLDEEQNAAIVAENERHAVALSSIEKATTAKKQAYEAQVRAEAIRTVEEANHFDEYIRTIDELIKK